MLYNMGRRYQFLLLVLLIFSKDTVYSWPSLALNDLSPPPGNSLLMKVKAHNGRETYGCSNGKWKLFNATAELVDVQNATTVGCYYINQTAHTWSLYNSPEDFAESGYPASEVSGVEIANVETEHGCSNILTEAIDHRYIGKSSLVSYVQRFFTKAERPSGSCTARSIRENIPFEAEYWLWYQDRVPPVETPVELLVSRERLVQGFFGKGHVYYSYNGTHWIQHARNALLFDVPGGTLVGRHYVWNPSNLTSSLVWELFNPNGFGVSAISSPAVQVAENCMPWSLNNVIHSWGNVSRLGPFTHVQMVSTRGGMPPSEGINAVLPLEPSTRGSNTPVAGDRYNSTFSAIFWFYGKPIFH